MSNLSLSRRISALKGHITRLINQIRDSIRRSEDEDTLIALRDNLYDRRDNFSEEIYNLIEKLIADDQISSADQKEKELKDVDSLIDRLNEQIEEYLNKINKISSPEGASNNKPLADYNVEKMTLPKFSGNGYFRWRSIYDVLIHNQPWTDSVKFLRLYECLENEPRELLKNFPPSNESYPLAVARLESVYGGRSRQVKELLQTLRCGKVIDGEDLTLLRRFISTLESITVTFKSSSDDNEALLQLAKERLSRDLLRKYLQWIKDHKASESYISLIDFLSEWYDIIDSTVDIAKMKPKSTFAMHAQLLNNSDKGSGQNKSQFKQNCLYHQKQKNRIEKHYLDTCTEFKSLSVKERRDFVFKNRLCRLCLKPNHVASDCRNPRAQCKKCSGDNKHHFLLHQNSEVTQDQRKKDVIESNNCQLHKQVTSLATIPLKICYKNKELIINAILDSGSNTSFVSREVIQDLGIPTFDEEQKFMNTMNRCNEPINVSRVNLNIQSLNGKWKRNETVFVSPKILINSHPVVWNEEKADWPHLSEVKFPQLSERPKHDMLLGVDLAHYHRSYKEIRGPIGAPIARLGPLGWSAFGPITCDNDEIENLEVQFCEVEGSLERQVQKMWELDVLGIKENLNEIQRLTIDECRAEELLKNNLKYNGERYEAPILWSESPSSLPDNFVSVLKRTQNMESKLKRKPEAWAKIKEVIKDYKDNGYICEEKDEVREKGYFLPYFPLIREDRETSKCRIVFDCSAKYNNYSLNDKILCGPKLQNDILNVLLRFRRYKFAIISDVSKMFLQIELAESDRCYCKFIFDNKIYKFIRTLFGRADSPYIALYVIKAHAEKYRKDYPKVTDSIQLSTYIDDFCESCSSENELLALYEQVVKIFKEAGMSIKKWNTNSKTVLDQIPEDIRAVSNEQNFEDTCNWSLTKVLGLKWNVEQDKLLYDIQLQENDIRINYTKRQVLKIISRMYDPLCLLCPFLNKSKVIFQKIWVSSVGWDENIPQQLNEEFRNWCLQIKNLKEIAIPRWVGLSVDNQYTVHLFSDASKDIYASLAYVRTLTDEGVIVRLLMAKSKVTPLKAKSIPCLELMAATLSLRLANKISQVLNYDMRKIFFWCDSADVLFQIRKPAKYQKTFVANRVSEIQTMTQASQWRYCPTKINVADIPTRFRDVIELKEDTSYWNGPEFLYLDEESWPKDVKIDATNLINKETTGDTCCVLKLEIMNNDFPLHPSRWSNLYRLMRRLSFVIRFTKNCKLPKHERILTPYLQPIEWQKAKNLLVYMCQQESFCEEIELLQAGKRLKKNSKLLKLCPFIDDDRLLRSKSRLQSIKWLSEEFKLPIILPKDHCITRLIVTEIHQSLEHPLGLNAALNELNKRYYVIGARVVMKKIKSKCLKCKIQNAKPSQQLMGPIPNFRFSEPHRAFSSIGIDFAGPFETIRGRGAARNKRYLTLFTCLKIRAVHLEMVYDLTTDGFLSAFQRMADRRGWPLEVLSDNGATFQKASKILEKASWIDPDSIERKAGRPIKWRFNPPYSAHTGGVFEILVKACKRALSKVLLSADVKDEELITAFCDVEALMNSRPLTAPSDSIEDEMPLTPNHFLIGRALETESWTEDLGKDVSPFRRWKYVRLLTSHFWRRWQIEILHGLRTRQKWCRERDNIKVGEVVLVLDSITSKKSWKLGRVTKVFEGSDGKVRTVSLLVQGKEYIRPVNKLIALNA